MALKKCHECGATVSTSAESCPACGAKPKKKTSILTWAAGAIAALTVISCINDQSASRDKQATRDAIAAATEAAKSPEQKAKEARDAAKKEADYARAVGVARTVKASAKNPDSFKLTSAIVTPSGAVCIEYRGTNSFNAVVPGHAVAPPGSSNVYADSAAQAHWGKHCAGKAGEDFTFLQI